SPETIRRRLRQFEDAHVDQVILLNQAGKTSHEDICESLDLFAREVMPEFHAREAAQIAWKQDVLAGRIVLEDLDTERYDLYAHQNEDIVRMTPEQLKQRMAEKERLAAAGVRKYRGVDWRRLGCAFRTGVRDEAWSVDRLFEGADGSAGGSGPACRGAGLRLGL